jgi:hypothetical protein
LSSVEGRTGFGLPILDLLPSGALERKRYATSERERWLEQCLDLVGKCLGREVLWPTRQKAERSNLATPPLSNLLQFNRKRLEAVRAYAYIALAN